MTGRNHRAVTFTSGEITVTERPSPEPEGEQVLVEVKAAGLNGADILQRAGHYPAPPGSDPDVPGLEFAGVVAAVGPGALRWQVGDRVMGITAAAGQAAQLICHERLAMPVPSELDWPAAGGFSEAFCTAHDALATQAQLRPGERLLINGAAGGVGCAAVQIGRLLGAEVVASARDAGAHVRLRQLGAGVAVCPDEVADHAPFDVVLELVGAPNFEDDLRNLNSRGRIVVIGIGAGAKATINLGLLLARRGRVMGSTLRARPLEEKAQVMRAVEAEVLPAVAAGLITVPVHATFRLDDAASAYDAFTAGGKLGKIVLLTQE